MKAKTIRRIIGITALVLWAVGIVSKVTLGNDDILWGQLDFWALLFAPIMTVIFAVMLTKDVSKGKHWAVKLGMWMACIIVLLLCLITFLFVGVFLNNHDSVWNNKDYAVYREYGLGIEPDIFVLYKRDGIVNHRMYRLGSRGFGQVKIAEYTTYEPLDLIKEETDWTQFESDSIFHITKFFRLSDGHPYKQDKNDSLLALINNK